MGQFYNMYNKCRPGILVGGGESPNFLAGPSIAAGGGLSVILGLCCSYQAQHASWAG